MPVEITTRVHHDTLGLSTINGLPAHILIVHAVVVFVPLSALALVASLRTSYAQRLGWWLPALAAVALISVLAAMNAGGWLENHVQRTTLVEDHTRIAGQLWPFSVVVLLASIVVWWRQRSAAVQSRRVAAGVAVVAVVVAVGSVVQVVRIGDSGSRAVWHDGYTSAAVNGQAPANVIRIPGRSPAAR